MDITSYINTNESEEYKLYKRKAEFSIPIYYVTQSYKQLVDYINYVFQTTETINWTLFDPFPNIGSEIDRLFFNFLSSTTLLIDNTRTFISNLRESNVVIENYDSKKNELFANNPIVKIIKELRNCYTHNKPILLTERIIHTKENGEDRLLVFSKTEVQPLFKNPDKKLKKYLEENNYEIDILKLTTDYYNTIMPFYQWLNSELKGGIRMKRY